MKQSLTVCFSLKSFIFQIKHRTFRCPLVFPKAPTHRLYNHYHLWKTLDVKNTDELYKNFYGSAIKTTCFERVQITSFCPSLQYLKLLLHLPNDATSVGQPTSPVFLSPNLPSPSLPKAGSIDQASSCADNKTQLPLPAYPLCYRQRCLHGRSVRRVLGLGCVLLVGCDPRVGQTEMLSNYRLVIGLQEFRLNFSLIPTVGQLCQLGSGYFRIRKRTLHVNGDLFLFSVPSHFEGGLRWSDHH